MFVCLQAHKDNKQLYIYNINEIRKTISSASTKIKSVQSYLCVTACISKLATLTLRPVACKQLHSYWVPLVLMGLCVAARAHSCEPHAWHNKNRQDLLCMHISAPITSFICSFRWLTNNRQDYCNVYFIY